MVVDLLGSDDGMPAYPAFVTLGENRFVMIKENGIWKIAEHQYDDAVLFEKSLDQLIGFDKAALKKRLDQEYAEP